MSDEITSSGESPSLPADMPDPEQWPGEDGSRELTEYKQPRGERDEPGAREQEQGEPAEPAGS